MNDRKSIRRKCLTAIAVALLLLAAGAFWVYRYASEPFDGDPVRINVPRGATASMVGDSLRSALGDNYGGKVFGIWKKMGGDNSISPGSYRVAAGEQAWRLARRIKNRRQDPVTLTFNNVRTLDDLASIVDDRMEMNSVEFLAATDSVLSSRNVAKPAFPAYFLPDTYEFYWTDSPEKVVNKIVGNHDRFWTRDRVARAGDLGLTPDQVSALASIVEEETNMAGERPAVARLYLNRLKKGMKLQADPTVKFAVGDFALRRITSRHLSIESPYNTYIHAGLPPGPIRMPDAATIDAVLNAPDHNYIYMCAREDFSGYHNFASDFASHQANARRYRAALDKIGIK